MAWLTWRLRDPDVGVTLTICNTISLLSTPFGKFRSSSFLLWLDHTWIWDRLITWLLGVSSGSLCLSTEEALSLLPLGYCFMSLHFCPEALPTVHLAHSSPQWSDPFPYTLRRWLRACCEWTAQTGCSCPLGIIATGILASLISICIQSKSPILD